MIYITDTLRISKIDENCLQLEALVPVTSKKTHQTTMQWKWSGYCGSLRDAFCCALRKKLFDTVNDELNIKAVIERIDAAEQAVIAAVKSNQKIE